MSLVTYVDLLIVGGGPAGLSAATAFSRLKRTCLLYDSGVYRNEGVKHAHLISGYEHCSPSDFRSKMKEDLLKYYSDTFEYRPGRITNLRKLDDQSKEWDFEAIDDQERLISAKKVVLATGLKDRLPDIQGVKEQWGKKIIHCIFCHGTETANAPFAFLLTKANAPMNPKLVESMLKLWRSLNHTDKYILTHGMDFETEQGRKDAGLEEKYDLIKKLGYKIISTPIRSITETVSQNALEIKFEDGKQIQVPAMLLFPEGFSANEHATSLLTEDFLEDKLAMFGTIAPPSKEMSMTGLPPRMGDDPRTNVHGLFWAGNSGSAFANVTISLAQGQNAAVMAGDQIGEEEMKKL
ncbi:uncharacterized protein I303_101086 [Kwoniella dejecticola CBS 10117]|uniref:FAD/NAD(P)-binding domain-containing protein n=1 Tax=Kwoniella dejecticola CBS 10117 TaxID=1296121 RepID=A0A1A6AGR5_9TREE|nr:uncharacterized protein I303_01090 [Kwoniella dejecticola CBS 10117]OBR89265.1 hypothetical protein I303_01090 [Kwoniella dejecticola CBS 10117]